MEHEARRRLETAAARGVGLRPGRDDDLVEVRRGDLRLLLASPTDMNMVETLRTIAQHTDPDGGEDNYRQDDREGCLDTVHALASEAVAGIEAEASGQATT